MESNKNIVYPARTVEDHFDKLRHDTKHARARTTEHAMDYFFNKITTTINTIMISITGKHVCSRLCTLLDVNDIAKEKVKLYKKVGHCLYGRRQPIVIY